MSSELSQQIETLQKNEEIEVTINKRKKAKSPPYTTIGNGMTTKDFKSGLVVDALRVFGALNPTQQIIVLHFRDALNTANMQAKQNKRPVERPNEVILSSIDPQDQAIKKMLRDNSNSIKLVEKGVIKKLKSNHYMVNPYMFIPPENFDKIAETWHNLEPKSNQKASLFAVKPATDLENTPQLDGSLDLPST